MEALYVCSKSLYQEEFFIEPFPIRTVPNQFLGNLDYGAFITVGVVAFDLG